MDHTPFTPRNVAKFVARTIVYGQAKSAAETTITNYTRFEEDDTVVNISSSVVGWYVSDKLKPVTDKMVDKASDYIVAKREARAAKKDSTDEQ